MTEEDQIDQAPTLTSGGPGGSGVFSSESDTKSKIKMDDGCSEKSFIQKTEADKEDAPPTEEEGRQDGIKTPEAPKSSQPHSTVSSPRVKSSASGEIVFEAKKKKSKLLDTSTPDTHTVTFSVNIAMAIPTEEDGCILLPAEDEESPDLKDMKKNKKQVFEAPRPQNYYHIEYYLIPEDSELMKTDIVTYGVAAKLYMERHDARVIKTWQDGELTWIAWAHSHTMTITKELLLKMFDHTLELRVWDTKDKCSSRARFDRPKAFRLPQPKPGENPENVGGVRAMVMKQMNGFLKMQPRKAENIRLLPQRCMFPRSELTKRGSSHTGTNKAQSSSPAGGRKLRAVAKSNGQESKTFGHLNRLAGAEQADQPLGGKESRKASAKASEQQQTQGTLNPHPPHSSHTSSVSSHSPTSLPFHSNHQSNQSPVLELFKEVPQQDSDTERRHTKKAEAAAAVAAENIRKFGICMIPFRMSLLFSGMRAATSRLKQPVPGVEDMFITISLSQPLLSDAQKQELNPTIITIVSATMMPNIPMSYEELSTRCRPVYCQYQFFKQPIHITDGKEHQKNLYFDDKNVVLLGQQDPSELREYLKGPSMVIEVHDRDRRPENVKLKATLFGDDLEDEKISNVGTVASRRTLHNAFHGRDKPWDPYGVCHVDLSELLQGHRFLELRLPILNCPQPDTLGLDCHGDRKVVGIAGAVDGPVDHPLARGDYMHAGSFLKLQMELAYPLVTPARSGGKEELECTLTKCPFGRIIFVFAYKNTTFLHKLQQLVMAINSRGLDMDDMPPHIVEIALSTYKLSIEQQTSKELDIVTGFHVLDGEKHIFVLEGLIDKGVRQLFEMLPRPESSDVRVLYNSDHSFSHRLYGALDVDLCRVKLHEPLSLVVQQSLLYIRDMVPPACFQALIRLEEITRMHLLKDVVKNNIFPTADMVISMSKEFGVPFTAEDLEELRPDWEADAQPVKEESEIEISAVRVQTPRAWMPIDNFNKAFVDSLAQRKEKMLSHDFVKGNVEEVQRVSSINQLLKEQTMVPTVRCDTTVAHNYSIQTLNSTELANQALRHVLKEDPDTRFTRCQDFQHSMTVSPVDPQALAKQEEQESKAHWRTKTGWIYPGKRSMIESNVHPSKPHISRIEELREKWQENIKHVSLLQPPLDRDAFPFKLRHHDFQLYGRPSPAVQETPLSIHLAGVRKQAEKLEAYQAEQQLWQSRLVVDDIRLYTHRLLPATEMKDSGFYSSNQIDRLTSLLKDPPQKHSLMQSNVRDIPPLSVVHYPSVDFLAREKGLPLPPAPPEVWGEQKKGYKPGPLKFRSLTAKDNYIPVYDYEHLKYAALYGHDFDGLYKERQTLWKRPIFPLTQEERDNHYFHQPVASIGLQALPLPKIGSQFEAEQDRTENAALHQNNPGLLMIPREQEVNLS
ncbi:uncharacterized protein LOC112571726 isoform X2 [Pomacea canaliculata]|uniref:uncharacterized protein LOC112571726 isoform X2 n=1 Tax=Pomacea canaliculata TaxID=400727 RepID=UPI000D7286A8|nr:uncharacterized protein LOC112571726 isoform X2 [Pomacea canaliculata]